MQLSCHWWIRHKVGLCVFVRWPPLSWPQSGTPVKETYGSWGASVWVHPFSVFRTYIPVLCSSYIWLSFVTCEIQATANYNDYVAAVFPLSRTICEGFPDLRLDHRNRPGPFLPPSRTWRDLTVPPARHPTQGKGGTKGWVSIETTKAHHLTRLLAIFSVNFIHLIQAFDTTTNRINQSPILSPQWPKTRLREGNDSERKVWFQFHSFYVFILFTQKKTIFPDDNFTIFLWGVGCNVLNFFPGMPWSPANEMERGQGSSIRRHTAVPQIYIWSKIVLFRFNGFVMTHLYYGDVVANGTNKWIRSAKLHSKSLLLQCIIRLLTM